MHEQQGGKERSYEEMVSLIKSAAEEERARLGDYCFDPALWIRDQIIGADTRKMHAENIPLDELGATPYAKLLMAWELISVQYIKPMYHVSKSNTEYTIREKAKTLGHTITLDPKESMLLDAMAEAVGIPNPYGQLTQPKKEPQ
jgi:hypothetical protein